MARARPLKSLRSPARRRPRRHEANQDQAPFPSGFVKYQRNASLLTAKNARSESLGKFVEVEGLVEDPLHVELVQQAVLALASQLGLVEVEPRSYLRQILEIG